METLLTDILNSPNLKEYAQTINLHIETEELKRLRFYEEITEQQKAEFINGEIVCHSPVKNKHSIASENLFILIKTFVAKLKLGQVRHEKILIQLTRNDYEPDICFFRKKISDTFTNNQMFFPAPDFIVEILSESTEKRDRGIKFNDYALHGVKEYWIVDPENQFVEQYILRNKKYDLFLKSNSGNIKSFEINDFEIPIQSIFDEDENLRILIELTKH